MRRFDPIKLLALGERPTRGPRRLGRGRGYRPKPLLRLSNVARGAPGDCTSNYSFLPCSENPAASPCSWKDGTDENTCTAVGKCGGCSGSGQHDLCGGAKPWNNLCLNDGVDGIGCDKWFLNDAVCTWDATKMQCRCKGTPDNAKTCARFKAKGIDDNCTVIKK